jgi:hypothetical protein
MQMKGVSDSGLSLAIGALRLTKACVDIHKKFYFSGVTTRLSGHINIPLF